MTRTRRIGTIIFSLIASALSLLAAAPSAFAMRVAPPAGGDGVSTYSVPAHMTGVQTWQAVLIAVAAAALAATVTAVIVRARIRSQLRPAIG